jgi:hypothetical protein
MAVESVPPVLCTLGLTLYHSTANSVLALRRTVCSRVLKHSDHRTVCCIQARTNGPTTQGTHFLHPGRSVPFQFPYSGFCIAIYAAQEPAFLVMIPRLSFLSVDKFSSGTCLIRGLPAGTLFMVCSSSSKCVSNSQQAESFSPWHSPIPFI